MDEYKKVFPKQNSLLTVIHVADYSQVLENVKIAAGEGADGVFLISHGLVSDDYVAACQIFIKTEFPKLWSGVNFLSCALMGAFRKLPATADGLWNDRDDVLSSIRARVSPNAYHSLGGRGTRRDWDGLYFGGVAFKYQPQPDDLASAALLATKYLDVITTSGEATGKPPSVEKITTMRGAIGGFPLAIASGMTPRNVHLYRDLADCFLVATGINKEHDFYNLDSKKVARFMKNIM